MGVVLKGWKNKGGTGERSCSCGTWKNHWIKSSGKAWPSICSIEGCSNPPVLGAHVINPKESGEYIVPACDSCNKRKDDFGLKMGTILVSANKQKTCG